MFPVYIRPYILKDAAAILDVNLRNRDHFEYWMPIKPSPEQYTIEGQRERIHRHLELMRQDAYYAYGVFIRDGPVDWGCFGDVRSTWTSGDVHDWLPVGCRLFRTRIYGTSGRIVRGSFI